MAEANKEMHSSQSSVELSVNAKGLWSGKVKVYADTIEEAFQLAEEKATTLSQKIEERNGQ
tara:strand:+ start:1419 stop:1601 length:183 start_codon:yes stop_codon:yes gene_type:complete